MALNSDSRDPQTYAIIGAAMEIHQQLGCGFLEAVYHQAMMLELTARAIPYQREVPLVIQYKGQPLPCGYRADFVCYDDVLVELKAIKQLTSVERAQVIHYLRATGLKRALLLNFGSQSLEYERIVLNAP
jgi:GxxExxY protein